MSASRSGQSRPLQARAKAFDLVVEGGANGVRPAGGVWSWPVIERRLVLHDGPSEQALSSAVSVSCASPNGWSSMRVTGPLLLPAASPKAGDSRRRSSVKRKVCDGALQSSLASGCSLTSLTAFSPPSANALRSESQTRVRGKIGLASGPASEAGIRDSEIGSAHAAPNRTDVSAAGATPWN